MRIAGVTAGGVLVPAKSAPILGPGTPPHGEGRNGFLEIPLDPLGGSGSTTFIILHLGKEPNVGFEPLFLAVTKEGLEEGEVQYEVEIIWAAGMIVETSYPFSEVTMTSYVGQTGTAWWEKGGHGVIDMGFHKPSNGSPQRVFLNPPLVSGEELTARIKPIYAKVAIASAIMRAHYSEGWKVPGKPAPALTRSAVSAGIQQQGAVPS